MKEQPKKVENKFIAYKIKSENLQKMKEYLNKQNTKK